MTFQLSAPHRRLCEQAAETVDSPFFVYDLDGFDRRIREWTALVPSTWQLWYACKANPLSSILAVVRRHGFGIDVASIGEFEQSITCGFETTIATGPAKTESYLRRLIASGVHTVVLESRAQARTLNEVARAMNRRVSALIRVQLVWESGESLLGGKNVTAFGEEADVWRTLDVSAWTHVDIRGMHVFQWSNVSDLSALASIWNHTADQCRKLARDMMCPLDVLDVGGGVGIPYNADQNEISFASVVAELEMIRRRHSIPQIWMEIGRYAIGPHGRYLTRVVDRKNVRGRELLVLEGGMNHIARPVLTGETFPADLLRGSSAESRTFQLHGPLCTALDCLGTHSLPADTAIGDWIVFHQAGAYGFTESMPHFLCHPQAAEIVIENEQTRIVRPPASPRDWMK